MSKWVLAASPAQIPHPNLPSPQPHALAQLPTLPLLPPNARYLRHPNRCYDWGTIGWVLTSKQVDTSAYKYFIFMNSSVRGPFIPPYAQVDAVRWSGKHAAVLWVGAQGHAAKE